jgi:hypothetical protein
MRLGDKPAYPRPRSVTDTEFEARMTAREGMTYREWLIGQALAGTCAFSYGEDGGYLIEHSARLAIGAADAVLAALEAEHE